MTFGKDIIHIFLLSMARPSTSRHLPNHHVSPDEILHLFFNVIVAVGADDLNLMTQIAQQPIGNFGQGVIQLAVGVREFFAPLIIRMLLILCPQEMRLLLILR